MAIKLYYSTLTHQCPKCNTVVKKETRDDAFGCLCVVAFIPIGLIALIVYLVNRKTKKREFNKYGEEIIFCPHCHSIVAVSSMGGIVGKSRIITQEKELLEMMKPIIRYLVDNFDIGCDKYNNDEKYSEILGLRFKNEYGEKCNVFVLNIMGKLEMKVEGEEYEAFDMEKLVVKIVEKLNRNCSLNDFKSFL